MCDYPLSLLRYVHWQHVAIDGHYREIIKQLFPCVYLASPLRTRMPFAPGLLP